MSYIKFENINKYYGKTQVLKDVSLDIEQGELVTLLGLSGCGKSTLLRCLAGLEQVTEGSIYMNGREITDLSARNRKIGMVFQQYSLFPNMNVEQNVAFGLKVAGESKIAIKERVDEIIDIVGLNEQRKKYPNQMSGGQQQRVALARALVLHPKVLLLDEPLSAIDALLRKSLQQEIKRLHKEFKMTTIFVTHDQDEAMIMSDTIHLMNNGKIEQSGTPDQVYTRPATPFVANFIGHYNFLKQTDLKEAFGMNEVCESAAIRPEVITISKEEVAKTITMGTVIGSQLHGSVLRYDIDCNGHAIQADTLYNGVTGFEDGSKVYLNFDKKDLIMF